MWYYLSSCSPLLGRFGYCFIPYTEILKIKNHERDSQTRTIRCWDNLRTRNQRRPFGPQRSTEDHLLLSSAKSISLSSAGTVNVDASEMTIQTEKIYLGSKSATEPLLLGATTVELLKTMIDVLKDLVTASQTASNSGGPIPSLNQKAPALLKKLLTLNPNKWQHCLRYVYHKG